MNSYTKLRDGSWGVRGSEVAEGATIEVKKQSGEVKMETVGRVLWKGDGVAIGTIARQATAPQPRAQAKADRGDPSCWECRRLGRMCKQCAFDEYDC
jgi:hypothetical protein